MNGADKKKSFAHTSSEEIASEKNKRLYHTTVFRTKNHYYFLDRGGVDMYKGVDLRRGGE